MKEKIDDKKVFDGGISKIVATLIDASDAIGSASVPLVLSDKNQIPTKPGGFTGPTKEKSHSKRGR